MSPSRQYTIACLAGDGVGPELMAEASRTLAAVSHLHGFGVTELHLPFRLHAWEADPASIRRPCYGLPFSGPPMTLA